MERCERTKALSPKVLERSHPFADLAVKVVVCECVVFDVWEGMQYLSLTFLLDLVNICNEFGIALVFDEGMTSAFSILIFLGICCRESIRLLPNRTVILYVRAVLLVFAQTPSDHSPCSWRIDWQGFDAVLSAGPHAPVFSAGPHALALGF